MDAHGVALVVATLCTGLVAGLFSTFAHAVMPGLSRSTDTVFVAGFQAIDRAISNPWQAVGFLGAPLATALAAGLHLAEGGGPGLGWTLSALGLYGAMVAITFRVHLPLNRRIQAAGDPARHADVAGVRRAFEQRWVRWNVVRAVLSTAAFGSLVGSLVLHGAA
ncbi:DUF1772 domain-containing protein [Cellulomonas cellasea]|uniref:Putative membrane protein n=1 Tax=Cellulomonas cellasea TaxID=43670 RepID=A0A7W4YAH0_9CELL|nr:DUF1772 domain-containing protein [Cellulomonas cellasea]MBB2921401.1 putative membrane protein [Cellulomonas cellasea]